MDINFFHIDDTDISWTLANGVDFIFLLIFITLPECESLMTHHGHLGKFGSFSSAFLDVHWQHVKIRHIASYGVMKYHIVSYCLLITYQR